MLVQRLENAKVAAGTDPDLSLTDVYIYADELGYPGKQHSS